MYDCVLRKYEDKENPEATINLWCDDTIEWVVNNTILATVTPNSPNTYAKYKRRIGDMLTVWDAKGKAHIIKP